MTIFYFKKLQNLILSVMLLSGTFCAPLAASESPGDEINELIFYFKK